MIRVNEMLPIVKDTAANFLKLLCPDAKSFNKNYIKLDSISCQKFNKTRWTYLNNSVINKNRLKLDFQVFSSLTQLRSSIGSSFCYKVPTTAVPFFAITRQDRISSQTADKENPRQRVFLVHFPPTVPFELMIQLQIRIGSTLIKHF